MQDSEENEQRLYAQDLSMFFDAYFVDLAEDITDPVGRASLAEAQRHRYDIHYGIDAVSLAAQIAAPPDGAGDLRDRYIRLMARQQVDFINVCEYILSGQHATGEFSRITDYDKNRKPKSRAARNLLRCIDTDTQAIERIVMEDFYKKPYAIEYDLPKEVAKRFVRIEAEAMQEAFGHLRRIEGNAARDISRAAFMLQSKDYVYSVTDTLSAIVSENGRTSRVAKWAYKFVTDFSRTPEQLFLSCAASDELTPDQLQTISGLADKVSMFKDYIHDGIRDHVSDADIRQCLTGFDLSWQKSLSGFSLDVFVNAAVDAVERDISKQRAECDEIARQTGGFAAGGMDNDPRYLWDAPADALVVCRRTGISPGMRARMTEALQAYMPDGKQAQAQVQTQPQVQAPRAKAAMRPDPNGLDNIQMPRQNDGNQFV